jgi:hypothetical protein
MNKEEMSPHPTFEFIKAIGQKEYICRKFVFNSKIILPNYTHADTHILNQNDAPE